ncbi:MAG TPA: hypothetical protein VK446_14765 [Methylocystis sp.]|nr:hypothetical protein [Methylocystis sp.]
MKPGETIGNWTSRAGVIRVRNALNPLLWTAALVTPTSWLAAYFFRDDAPLKYFFSGMGSLPVFGTLIAYFIYMFRDPDRLQSEEYLLRQHAIQILYKKDATTEIVDIVNEAPRLQIEKRAQEDKP